jgi:hypothetical protein
MGAAVEIVQFHGIQENATVDFFDSNSCRHVNGCFQLNVNDKFTRVWSNT